MGRVFAVFTAFVALCLFLSLMLAMEEELTPAILAARAKLRERCAKSQQLGGKGTARRKARKTHKSVVGDDKKLQLTLKRLGATSIFGVEEVFLLRADGSALRFLNPKVQAAPTANTYVVAGAAEEKANAGSLLGVRGLLGGAAGSLDASGINPEMLKQLQEHVESFSRKERQKETADGEDDVPDLVENFEEAAKE